MSVKMSVVELPLVVEKWQADILDKKFEIGRAVYNAMLGKKWNQLKEIKKTRKWREDNSFIYNAKKDGKRPDKETAEALKKIYADRNELLKENGFTKFGFTGEVAKYSKPYAYHLPASVAIHSIANPLWACFSSILFRDGEHPHFKQYGEFNSLASDNKSGIRFLMEDGKYYILMSNRSAGAKPLKMQVRYFTDYDRDMMNRKVKIARVIRKMEHSKYHYYCQLAVEGSPYIKNESDIPSKTGVVGLAIWRNELYAVSDEEVKRFSLCPNLKKFEEQREALSRRMEELRRFNNPDNFNEDGTIKKGIVVNGVKQRLVWHNSVAYLEAKKDKRELERKNRVSRQIYQNKIVKELLAMGDSFIMADTSFLTKKPDPEEELTNTEYKKKKERRKSIQESAPSALLARLDMKLAEFDRCGVSKIKVPKDMYWYQHVEDKSDKKLFNGENVVINGEPFNQTAYRAFLAKCYDLDKNSYNRDVILDTWDRFICNQ